MCAERLLGLGRLQNPDPAQGRPRAQTLHSTGAPQARDQHSQDSFSLPFQTLKAHRLSQSFRLPVLSHRGEKPPGAWMPPPDFSSRLGNEKPAPRPHAQTAPPGGLPLPTQHQQEHTAVIYAVEKLKTAVLRVLLKDLQCRGPYSEQGWLHVPWQAFPSGPTCWSPQLRATSANAPYFISPI